jgi:hypothetical protein
LCTEFDQQSVVGRGDEAAHDDCQCQLEGLQEYHFHSTKQAFSRPGCSPVGSGWFQSSEYREQSADSSSAQMQRELHMCVKMHMSRDDHLELRYSTRTLKLFCFHAIKRCANN